jgi:cold shock CspA family protein
MRGRVDWYSAALDYGFIIPGDGSAKVLVRDAYIEGDGSSSLENGDEVTYEAIQSREG